jgi:Fic family protein
MRLTKGNIEKFTTATYEIEELKPQPCHFEAIEYIKQRRRKKPTIGDIMNLHEIIMSGFTDKLQMRTGPLMVGNRRAPDPREIPQMFLAWLDTWGKTCYKSFSKKKHCFLRHCEFEYIHPFPEGNGVVGRLIYLWDCLYNSTQMDIIIDREKSFKQLDEYNYELRSRILSRWS